jgi:hypothetical protein
MFVFNKNYQELMSLSKFQKMVEFHNLEDYDESNRYRVFTIDFVIKKIIDFSEDKA